MLCKEACFDESTEISAIETVGLPSEIEGKEGNSSKILCDVRFTEWVGTFETTGHTACHPLAR